MNHDHRQFIELKPVVLIWTENKSLPYEFCFIPEFSDSNVGNDVKIAELSSDTLCVLRNTPDRFVHGSPGFLALKGSALSNSLSASE